MTEDSSIKPIFSFMEMKLPLFDRRQLELDQDLMELLICVNLPFIFVENKRFRNWASKYLLKFTIKSATTFSWNIFPLLYNELNKAGDSMLEVDPLDCVAVAFTTDIWASCNNYSYISTILHYIDKDSQLEECCCYGLCSF